MWVNAVPVNGSKFDWSIGAPLSISGRQIQRQMGKEESEGGCGEGGEGGGMFTWPVSCSVELHVYLPVWRILLLHLLEPLAHALPQFPGDYLKLSAGSRVGL